MGGAFVGVADDASAGYWNPAGLAGGAYFSLLIDGNTAESVPDAEPVGADSSGWILALSMPALGLSYTRLQSTTVRPAFGFRRTRASNPLVTHHARRHAGAVDRRRPRRRGDRESWFGHRRRRRRAGNDREELLDHVDLIGHSSTSVDLDIGVMAVASFGRAGLTVRNLTDLHSTPAAARSCSSNAKPGRAARCCCCRNGSWRRFRPDDRRRPFRGCPGARVRHRGTGDAASLPPGAASGSTRSGTVAGAPAVSVGGSYAVFGPILVDGQITGGSDNAFSGWGLAGGSSSSAGAGSVPRRLSLPVISLRQTRRIRLTKNVSGATMSASPSTNSLSTGGCGRRRSMSARPLLSL